MENTPEPKKRHHTLEKVSSIPRLYRSTRNGVYFLRKCKSGRVFTRSLRTRSLPNARKKYDAELEALEQEIKQAFSLSFQSMPYGKHKTGNRIKYKDGLELSFGTRLSAGHKGATVKGLAYRLQVLRRETIPLWGDKTVRDIDQCDVKDWLRGVLDNGRSPSTHNTYLTLLKRTFKDMIEHDRRQGVKEPVDNPADFLRSIRVMPKVYIPENQDIVRVIEWVETRNRLHAAFHRGLWFTGARWNELYRLTWADVGLDKRIIQMPNSKAKVGKYGSDGYREIPMNQNAYDLLAELARTSRHTDPEDQVFPGVEKQASIRWLRRGCETLAIKNFTPHCLRHAFATNAIECDVDIPTVARWLGHRDGGVLLLKTYGHLRHKHSEAMAARVTFNT